MENGKQTATAMNKDSRYALLNLKNTGNILCTDTKKSLAALGQHKWTEARLLALEVYSDCKEFMTASDRISVHFDKEQRELVNLCTESRGMAYGIRNMQKHIVRGKIDRETMQEYGSLAGQFERQNDAIIKAIEFVFSIWPPGI